MHPLLRNRTHASILAHWIHLIRKQVLSLPFPDNATFKYAAHLIGPGLRPEDPERCLTSDMCIPIFPNTYHPAADRESLEPRTGPFPFSNCYHWFGPDMIYDLRVWNDGKFYTEEQRVSLPASQQVRLEHIRSRDVWRAFDTMEAKNAATDADLPSPKADTQEEQDPAAVDESCMVHSADSQPPPPPVDQQVDPSEDSPVIHGEVIYGSGYDSASSGSASSIEEANGEDAVQADIFGLDFDENEDLLPIVNVWPDVGAQFDEDIPNPMEFAKQYYEVVKYGLHFLMRLSHADSENRIIYESKARAKLLRSAESEKGAPLAECSEGSFECESMAGRKRGQWRGELS